MKRSTLALVLSLATQAGNVLAAQPALDPSFGDDGIAAVAMSAPHATYDVATASILLRDGFSYLHIGSTSAGLVVSRQHARGAIDRKWGRDGTVELDDDRWQLTPTAAAMQTKRRLLVAGYATARSDGRVVPLLCRFLSYGAPDPSMQAGANAPTGCRLGLPSTGTVDEARDEAALALAVQPDDGILVATRSGSGADATLHVNSLDADGAPAAVFGALHDPLFAQAFVTLAPSAEFHLDGPLPIAGLVHDGERVLLAGTANVVDADAASLHHDMFVAAFDMDGLPALGFGDAATPGFARVALAAPATADPLLPPMELDEQASDDVAIAFRRLASGALLLAGTTTAVDGELLPVVVRLRADGTRDDTFGDAGIATLPPSSVVEWTGLSDMVTDVAGRVVLAGSVVSTLDGHQVGVARLRADGTLDAGTGEDGVLRFDFAPGVSGSAASVDLVSSVTMSWPGTAVLVGGQAENAQGEFRIARLRVF